HSVSCIDMVDLLVEIMQAGHSPFFESGLDDLLLYIIEAGRLIFTTEHLTAFKEAQVLYIAVGTPENEEGSANLTYVIKVIG
ncbi:UDP-glucose 6-dehydrogenase, partial [Bacillus cereus]|nr:UDP-glucose 6-dehydrogenase [Bacillus cereus]